jgi:hypothetical protein
VPYRRIAGRPQFKPSAIKIKIDKWVMEMENGATSNLFISVNG